MAPLAWHQWVNRCERCTACRLHETRNRLVLFRGARPAPLMILGEGPGATEDATGQPFVGRSGKLLDALLAELALQEKDVHFANLVKCRPPKNRAPHADEVAACRPLLQEQIRLVGPKVLLLCGSSAYHFYTGRKDPISKVRGQWMNDGAIDVLPSFHPAYVLRNQRMRPLLLEDFLKVRERLEERRCLPPRFAEGGPDALSFP